MAATCKSCGAPIIWIKSPAGQWLPLDEGLIPYKQNDAGHDSLVNDWGVVIRCDLQFEGEPTGLARRSHFATCPYADKHRKARR